MRPRRSRRLDLQDLPRALAAALEGALRGEEVLLARGAVVLGTLSIAPVQHAGGVLEGALIAPDRAEPEPAPIPSGALVVATAMELSAGARSRLAEEFGEGFVVLDLHEAPPTADVLLVPPISPQLLAALRSQFPRARMLIAEIEDEDLGVHYAGPVTRMLEAGAAGYLPAGPLPEVARSVREHLDRQTAPTLGPGVMRHGDRPGGALPPASR